MPPFVERAASLVRSDLLTTWQSLSSKGAARAMAVVAGGVFGARVLTALGYLVIAWFYSAEVFGLFSVYIALSLVLQLVITAGYSGAIVVEKEDRCAALVTGVSLAAAAVILSLVTAAVLLVPEAIARLVGVPALAELLWVLPIGVAARMLQTLFTQWSIRSGRFGDQALTHIAFAGVQTGGQAVVAVGGMGTAFALVMIDLAAVVVSVAVLAWHELRPLVRVIRAHVTGSGLWEAAVQWRDMPRFALLTNLITGAWQQGPVLVAAAALGGGAVLGQVALALRALELVLQVVNASLSNVAMRHMAQARGGERYQQFKRFARQLFLAGLGVYLVSAAVLFVGVPFVLKPGWADVPVLFGLLVPAYVLNVTVVPVWFVYTLARRLGRGLLLRLAYLAVLALAWLYAVATQDLYGALICFSLCGAAVGAMVLVDMRGILRAGIDPAEEQEARDALAKPVTAGD